MDWNERLVSPRTPIDASGTRAAIPLPERLAWLATHQEAAWPELTGARDAWFACRYREVDLGAWPVRMQYNPARERSVSAPVDDRSVRARPCFLCARNMPAPERGVALDHDFAFFLNPFPIFDPHPVAIHREHRPQALDGCLDALLDAARRLRGAYTVLYNGPRCGASAPDHLHFQAFPAGGTPLETDIRRAIHPGGDDLRLDLLGNPSGHVFSLAGYGRTLLVLRSAERRWLRRSLDRLVAALPAGPEGGEPLLNLVAWHDGEAWVLSLFPRRRHRPAEYSTRPGEGVLVSPGSIDLSGLVVTPRREDFERLDAERLRSVFGQVCLPPEELPDVKALLSPHRTRGRRDRLRDDTPATGVDFGSAPAPDREPILRVGLVEGQPAIELRLDGPWRMAGKPAPGGWFRVERGAGRFRLEGPDGRTVDLGALPPLEPAGPEAAFTLRNVTIGADFHWQRQEDQTFPGALELVPEAGGGLSAVNRVSLEEYLACVIASEMRADAPLEFLAAHAVISRSWLLAQLAAARRPVVGPAEFPPLPGRILAWTDREKHRAFDVCADDHCQRYQGLERVAKPEVRQAVAATRGKVLADALGVVDARFSKCCGGMTESFRSAWGDFIPPSLRPVRDLAAAGAATPDLTVESAAQAWIEAAPDAFCRVEDPAVLGRILPDFDRETRRFFRWELEADAGELAETIRVKSGWDPGDLLAMVPVQRGASGRLVRLLLLGTRGRLLVGKELEIRRLLSPTHLYSSAFTPEPLPGPGGRPRAFRLRGAGWGHGVGLCQIGAAAMACRGYDHARILAHYFPGARLERGYP